MWVWIARTLASSFQWLPPGTLTRCRRSSLRGTFRPFRSRGQANGRASSPSRSTSLGVASVDHPHTRCRLWSRNFECQAQTCDKSQKFRMRHRSREPLRARVARRCARADRRRPRRSRTDTSSSARARSPSRSSSVRVVDESGGEDDRRRQRTCGDDAFELVAFGGGIAARGEQPRVAVARDHVFRRERQCLLQGGRRFVVRAALERAPALERQAIALRRPRIDLSAALRRAPARACAAHRLSARRRAPRHSARRARSWCPRRSCACRGAVRRVRGRRRASPRQVPAARVVSSSIARSVSNIASSSTASPSRARDFGAGCGM